MDLEFDKEMDALLRQSAQGETAFAAANPKSQIPNPKSAHLDADEISAFAENALPEKSRQKYMLHLADCDWCRKSLSSLITLDSETENTAVHAEEKHFIAAPIPWYRRLFAFPNPAYALGALVLVFSGIAAYTVLQSGSNFGGAEVSQTYEKQPNGKGMSSDGDTAAVESYSSNSMMSNAASMNSTSNSAANLSAMPAAPIAAANSNAAMVREEEEADKNLPAETKPLPSPKEPVDSPRTGDSAGAPPPAKENESQSSGEARKQQPEQTQDSIAQNQTTIAPDSRNVQRPPSPALRAENKSKKLEGSKDDAREKSPGTTSVGGKTFKRENNVWYDSAYRGQATVNVTRGTQEYKKLDAGLRGIADNLGGTVVVVWKQKAYRIQ